VDIIVVFNSSGEIIDTFSVPEKACGRVIEKSVIPARVGNIKFTYQRKKEKR